uniref:Uncharacterized protein n=1 Tax=Rhizophora mucronata TaxID=61149 RepID=A0A2P2JDM8_RHIMU
MQIDPWGYKSGSEASFQDLIMVPNDKGIEVGNGNVSIGERLSVSKRQQLNPNRGKHKQVLHKQLAELYKRDLMATGEGGGGENMVRGSRTPSWSTWQGDVEEQHVSLLRLPSQPDPKPRDWATWGDVLRNTNASKQGTQIWDFHLGQLRTHDGDGELENSYGSNNSGLPMNSVDEFIGETLSLNAKVLEDVFPRNGTIADEAVISFDVSSYFYFCHCAICNLPFDFFPY